MWFRENLLSEGVETFNGFQLLFFYINNTDGSLPVYAVKQANNMFKLLFQSFTKDYEINIVTQIVTGKSPAYKSENN